MRIMSTTNEGHVVSLEGLATRWLASKKLARPSLASDAARRADLAVVAAMLADEADRAEDSDLASFERQLSRLEPADFTAHALQDAFANLGADHAPSSVRRVLSTWRGFCRWLLAEGVLASIHRFVRGRAARVSA